MIRCEILLAYVEQILVPAFKPIGYLPQTGDQPAHVVELQAQI
jgi:hypothetical protein